MAVAIVLAIATAVLFTPQPSSPYYRSCGSCYIYVFAFDLTFAIAIAVATAQIFALDLASTVVFALAIAVLLSLPLPLPILLSLVSLLLLIVFALTLAFATTVPAFPHCYYCCYCRNKTRCKRINQCCCKTPALTLLE